MKRYKVAAYLRISNEDGDHGESNSIDSQRSIVKEYIENHNDMELIDIYSDDGYTGTNFNRPGIQELFKDIEVGRINCLIIKDLSRFGRDYIEVGRYLDKVFPEKGIRVVAINDGYDSIADNSADSFVVPIKNVFNAHYSQDISKKVKSAFRAKQKQGKFTGAFPGYGFKKSEHDKHKLVIDEDAAMVVRRVFELYNSGVGKIGIAKILNDEHIPCPSEYKKLKGLNYKNCNRLDYTGYWTYSTIHRMLSNSMYKGDMVLNRSERRTVRGNAYKLDKEQWIVVENMIEPIIDIDLWNTTQALLKKRTRQLDFDSEIGLFAGYIRCGDCGRAFSKIKRGAVICYVCGSYKRYSKEICSRHEVKEELLERLILDRLNIELDKIESIKLPKTEIKDLKKDKRPYLIQLEKIYKLKKGLYEDLKDGIIDRVEYDRLKKSYQNDEELIKGQMKAMEEQDAATKEKNEWIENLKKYKKLDKLDRQTLACIIDSITVYETETEKSIDIKLKYVLH